MKWYCNKLRKQVATSKDAIPDKDIGFCCDCGLHFDGKDTWKTYHLNLGTELNPNWVLRWEKVSPLRHRIVGISKK